MKSFRFVLALVSASVLAACSTSGLAPASLANGVGAPKGEVPLGDYGALEEARIGADFSTTVAARYQKGLAMKLAVGDLDRSKFTCGPPAKSKAVGDPPSAVCRRSIGAGACTHTWQVHL